MLSVFDFHSVHFIETKDFYEMFKIMKFCAIVLCTCTDTWTSCSLVLVLGLHILVLVLVFAPLVLVLVLDDIVLATRLPIICKTCRGVPQ